MKSIFVGDIRMVKRWRADKFRKMTISDGSEYRRPRKRKSEHLINLFLQKCLPKFKSSYVKS